VYTQLLSALEAVKTPVILVAGDLMLDRYLWGDVERISPEAPVQVVQIDREKTHTTVGGAGSVMRDLVALGARTIAAGVVGDDAEGSEVLATLKADGVEVALVVVDKGRRTTHKTRVLSKSHHLLRIDSEDKDPLDEPSARRLVDAIKDVIDQVDLVVLSDYDKGVLSRETIAAICHAARAAGKPVWADPAKGLAFSDFIGVNVVTPNRKETEEASGLRIAPGKSPEQAAHWLITHLELDAAVVTLDSEGLYYRTASGGAEMIASQPRAAYDVTGAGDMVIAAAAFGVAGGMPLNLALQLANFAAGMEVERIGAQPIPRREIIRRLRDAASISSEKIVDLADLKTALDQRRRRGERIVFTNGCFDILHVGHTRYLQFARSQGDLLVVGLNSDRSVRSIKKEPRPILTQTERAALLAALETVDYVVVFDDDTPESLINEVKPDILVKGEDWRDKGVVGRESVEARGGKVVLAPMVPGISTTDVVKRILDAYSGGQAK
jgi:D-beta-D-heptose 7-phosphate kinase / D-beta-D-heptose 1-phosphate adenosyltransferase